MTKQLFLKNLLLGFLSWLIPFALSFLFYKPGGELTIPYAAFKTCIMALGVISGCYLLFRYFKFVTNNFISNGVIVGFTWFAVNILLDTLVLIPMMKTTFTDYFMSVGLSYIAIPVISITIGCLLESKRRV